MRTTSLLILVLGSSAVAGPAWALDASDTMAAWAGASADAKSKLVTEILKHDGREGAAAGVVQCLDAAASVSGHADLSIGKVVEACEKEGGDPV